MAFKVEILLNATWTDITSYVRQDPGLDITVGVQNEGGVADAATAQMVLNNTDGRFTPRNTAGAYYPYLTRNTPLRITNGAAGRFAGEVAEFPSRWIENGNVAWVPITASGLLRRLTHGSSLRATLASAVLGLAASNGDIVGYWPIEDGSGATSIASAFATGTPGTFTGAPVFGAVDLGVGTHNVATWAASTAIFSPTVTASSTEFTAGFYVSIPETGLTGGEELFRVNVDGTATSWRVIYSPGSSGALFLQVIASDGVTEILASSNLVVTGGMNGRSFYVKIEANNNGANVDWDFSQLGIGPGGTLSGTINTRTVGKPVMAAIGSGVIAIPAGADVAIGHVVLGNTDTALFATRFDDGLRAFAGESIETRLARLATEYGIAISVTSGAASPVELGAQPDGTLLDVLRAAEKADAGGILRDGLSSVSLTYITRNARYNDRQAQLVLNYATAGQICAPLEPTDDDQQIRNDVTVNRIDGSSARATLGSGALSTLDYPNGVGLYQFEDSYGTYSDDALPYLADWILALGTIDETRFPAVTVDLKKNPSLVTDVEAVRPGYRLRLTNLPSIAGAANVDLQVVGWREVVTAKTRRVTFICAPGSIWSNVFELDDATFGTLNDNRLGF